MCIFLCKDCLIRAVQWAREWMGSALGQVSTMWF